MLHHKHGEKAKTEGFETCRHEYNNRSISMKVLLIDAEELVTLPYNVEGCSSKRCYSKNTNERNKYVTAPKCHLNNTVVRHNRNSNA